MRRLEYHLPKQTRWHTLNPLASGAAGRGFHLVIATKARTSNRLHPSRGNASQMEYQTPAGFEVAARYARTCRGYNQLFERAQNHWQGGDRAEDCGQAIRRSQ